MHRRTYPSLPLPSVPSVLALLLLVPACGTNDNNVGTIPHGSGGSNGATGTGGIGAGYCTDADGKSYALGESFRQDCNTCECEIDGIWCTDILCLHTGGAPGSPGTGGLSGSGGGGGSWGVGGISGNAGTGGVGYCTDADGKTYALGESFRQDCNTCTCQFMGDAMGTVIMCTLIECTGGSVDAAVGSGDGPGGEVSAAPGGLCLLAYNDALAPDGTDPCCYRQGSANACNTAIECNARSGPGCCLVYGTENTSQGYRCCLYADGDSVDGADECRQLLGGAAGACDGEAVAWQTSTVSLQAEAFWIVADGLCYTSRGAAVQVRSDPGHSRYTTLELIWIERGREMRWNIYLEADASGWWSEEMRTYDGRLPNSDWLYYYGRFFSSPIGQPFRGDIALTNDPQDKIRGELHLQGLTLSTTMSGS